MQHSRSVLLRLFAVGRRTLKMGTHLTQPFLDGPGILQFLHDSVMQPADGDAGEPVLLVVLGHVNPGSREPQQVQQV